MKNTPSSETESLPIDFEFTDKYGKSVWITVGRFHPWNFNIDVTSIHGQRIPYGSCDIADYDHIFAELRAFGCKYTDEQYETIARLGKKRQAFLEQVKQSSRSNSK